MFVAHGWSEHKTIRLMGVSRTKMRYFLDGRGKITPEIAIAISKTFGGLPKNWMVLQAEYDLEQYAAQKVNSSS